MAPPLVPCTVLPCTEASYIPGRYFMRLMPSHRRELQTAVSTVADLTSALANTAVGRIVLASGTYYLSAELSITRSVVLEAAVAGSVVLDGGHAFRVLNVNPGSSGVVQVIGLNITGGYVNDVRAHAQKLPSPRWETHVLLVVCTGRRRCHCQGWHSFNRQLPSVFQPSY